MNDKWVLLKRDPRLSRRVLRLETRDGVRGAVVKVEPKKAAAILTASDDGGRWFPLGELAFIPQFVKGDVVICVHGVEPKHRGIVFGGNHEYSKVMWDDGRTFGQKNIELLKIGSMHVFEIPDIIVDPLAKDPYLSTEAIDIYLHQSAAVKNEFQMGTFQFYVPTYKHKTDGSSE